MRSFRTSFLAMVWLVLAVPITSWSQLPREASELLLIGDSVTAGIYFLALDQESMRQAWSGQVIQRLGMEVPRAPYDDPFPINHLKLAKNGFGFAGMSYAWEGRRAFLSGKRKYRIEDERIVLAIPGQTLYEVLHQSSKTRDWNQSSSGWTFANILLPKDHSVIETVEAWKKRPRWVVVFIGSNDLLAYFGLVGRATPPPIAVFREQYAELVCRLRNIMAKDAPAKQMILMTLPDVTRLPFIQEPADTLENGVSALYPFAEVPIDTMGNGLGAYYPPGSKMSAFLIEYRKKLSEDQRARKSKEENGEAKTETKRRRAEYRLTEDEVWTPHELQIVRQRGADYNTVIKEIAEAGGYTLLDIGAMLTKLAADPLFGTSISPYFSPDLHHPSYRTHRIIADAVLTKMATIAGTEVPDALTPPDSLPSAYELSGDSERKRTNAMMHLAVQGLESGPLPPRFTYRVGFESGAQGGNERVGEVVFSPSVGVEMLPIPVSTRYVMRLGASARCTIAALQVSNEDTEFFPRRSFEIRVGAALEPIGAWDWDRWEFGGLVTPDDDVDFGMYARKEIHAFYGEISSRGWVPDRIELGVRIGGQPHRSGRNGN